MLLDKKLIENVPFCSFPSKDAFHWAMKGFLTTDFVFHFVLWKLFKKSVGSNVQGLSIGINTSFEHLDRIEIRNHSTETSPYQKLMKK